MNRLEGLPPTYCLTLQGETVRQEETQRQFQKYGADVRFHFGFDGRKVEPLAVIADGHEDVPVLPPEPHRHAARGSSGELQIWRAQQLHFDQLAGAFAIGGDLPSKAVADGVQREAEFVVSRTRRARDFLVPRQTNSLYLF